MKYILMILFVSISAIGFTQEDSMKSYSTSIDKPGTIRSDAEYLGEESLDKYLTKNISSNVRYYINCNNLNSKFFALMRIDPNGKVANVQIPQGENQIVEDEIKKLLEQTKWKPATINGVPVNRKVLVPITILY